MLPTPPQPAAAAAGDAGGAAGGAGAGASGEAGDGDAGEKEKFGEATEFINWEGRGAADLILPEIKENSDDDDNVRKGCHHCALL